MDIRRWASKEFDIEANARIGAILQYGADMTIATAMAGFSTLIWVAPATSETGWLWDTARTITSGFSGMWIGVALIRLHISWKHAAETYSRIILGILLVLCFTAALAAVFVAIIFANTQKISAACDRAEAARHSQIAESAVCREYFAQRAASDFEIFKSIGK